MNHPLDTLIILWPNSNITKIQATQTARTQLLASQHVATGIYDEICKCRESIRHAKRESCTIEYSRRCIGSPRNLCRARVPGILKRGRSSLFSRFLCWENRRTRKSFAGPRTGNRGILGWVGGTSPAGHRASIPDVTRGPVPIASAGNERSRPKGYLRIGPRKLNWKLCGQQTRPRGSHTSAAEKYRSHPLLF